MISVRLTRCYSWDNEQRGSATAVFTLAPFAGPAIGPIVGGYISLSGVSWQWLFWVLTIFVSHTLQRCRCRLNMSQSGLCWVLILVSIPETYGPVILVKKAKQLRASTGDSRYKAALEMERVSFGKKVGRILGRPWKIFFVEAMLVVVTLYMSVSVPM